jgi:anti-sigma regulatory factor (Ser/Thr protein kinase)
MDETGSSTGADLPHLLLPYRTADEYTAAVSGFLLADATTAGPALVAIPPERQQRVRQAIAAAPAPVAVTDISELGRNPARIIPALLAFANGTASAPARVVCEPAWPGRSEAEIREVLRHEALVNLAFAGRPVTMLCLYDAARLPDGILADACRTHPLLSGESSAEPSVMFAGTGALPPDCDRPLPAPPAAALAITYRSSLREVRDLVADQASLAGLPHPRAVDFVLAVSEVAANTLRHTTGEGTIRLWRSATELICQLDDSGQITDPLAGRRPPDHDHPGGQGLWLVNQVCDLVEVRTGKNGTAVRLHLRLGEAGQPAQASASAAVASPRQNSR